MPSLNRATLLVLLLGLLRAAPLAAQGYMIGIVRDSAGRGLADAQVLLESTRYSTRTDSAGRYHLVVAAGNHRLIVRQVGYTAAALLVRVADGDTLRNLVTLVRGAAPELEAVEVRADREYAPGRAGFAHRKFVGLGKFVDSTELRHQDGRDLSTVLRRVPGVRIVPGNPRVNSGSRKEHAMNTVGDCYVAVMFDNVWIYRGMRGEEPPDLRKDFLVMDLESIEYYRGGAPLPPEFSIRHADCGVLVLWSRRGQVRR